MSVEGPDLAAILGPPTGLAPLPTDPFALSAHVHGSSERFTADRFTARLGDSDLEGSVSVRLDGKPFVEADLRSKRIDALRLRGELSQTPAPEKNEGEASKTTRSGDDRVISDQPLSLGALRGVDGRLRLVMDEVTVPGVPIRDVEIAGELRDGAMTLDHIEGTGVKGGRVTGNLSLAPQGDGYRVHAEARVEDARLVLGKDAEPQASAPSLDVDYEVGGVGQSLREMAASAGGRVLVVMGAGRVPNAHADLMSSGVLIALLDALNPFRKSSPYTEVDCGVAAAGIEDGKMVVEPIAVPHRQDDGGRQRQARPRNRGHRPRLDDQAPQRRRDQRRLDRQPVHPAGRHARLASPRGEAAQRRSRRREPRSRPSGSTVLSRGIYNRITAEKKVCVDALAEARKQEERAPDGRARSRASS